MKYLLSRVHALVILTLIAAVCVCYFAKHETKLRRDTSAREIQQRGKPLSVFEGDFRENGIPPTFANRKEEFRKFGSWKGVEGSQGRYVSRWYRVRPKVAVLVSGYPTLSGNTLYVEVAGKSDSNLLPYEGSDPGSGWKRWELRFPGIRSPEASSPEASGSEGSALRFRLVVADDTPTGETWVGISEPFLSKRLPAFPLLLVCGALSLTMLLGPGLLFRRRYAAKPAHIQLLGVLCPGLILCAGIGAAEWYYGAGFSNREICFGGVLISLVVLLIASLRVPFENLIQRADRAVLGSIVLLVILVTARSSFSGGPPGELFSQTISRTGEASICPDSRISYHVTQLVAHHLSPFEAEAQQLFAPWLFSDRGPLAGFVAAPLVLLFGEPPRGLPAQSWEVFDEEGFMAYRISMFVLAGMSLFSVFYLFRVLFPDRNAGIAVMLLASSPFFVYQTFFTWPKLIAASFAVAALLAMCRDSRASRSSMGSISDGLLAAVCFGIGYLFHPSALLAVPAVALALLFNARRTGNLGGAIWSIGGLGCGVTCIALLWFYLNYPAAGQGTFVRYLIAADGALPEGILSWTVSRLRVAANVLLPGYTVLFEREHPALTPFQFPRDGRVQFFHQYFVSLPFAMGLTLFVYFLYRFKAVRIELKQAMLLTAIVAAFLTLVLFWGNGVPDALRGGGQFLFLLLMTFVIGLYGEGVTSEVDNSSSARAKGASVIGLLRSVELLLFLYLPIVMDRTGLVELEGRVADGIALFISAIATTTLCFSIVCGRPRPNRANQ